MSVYKTTFTAVSLLALSSCNSSVETAPVEAAVEKIVSTSTIARVDIDQVEITLIDKLDGVTSSYCVDIAGGNENIDISKGLQAHTCYSYRGSLGSDQIFSTKRFSDNVLYMPEYDVCATIGGLKAGSVIGLASCDGSSLQKIAFTGTGQISPVDAPSLCFTAATDSRFGRSQTHQIKALSLENCTADLAPYQQWRTRATED